MPSVEKLLYSARTHTRGGRDGVGCSDDGRLQLKLSPPGVPANGSNPEQLFAVSWSASFLSALRHACNARKLAFPEAAAVDAQVELLHAEQGFFLRAHFTVTLPDISPEVAEVLVQAAQHNCPYSKATRGNIAVTLSVA
ncbi:MULTISPECIES: Ohr family peroxiredoxin [unclassified Pseudomonas]|uniref:Ohr family peroxiredoxin n=1 Tax=unclassified Pseudomonas TaxID=196821 RepID=UPI000A1D956B|nr:MULTISPECIES: Ohr family peroxiredoxin [unclassified Pseudomonas]